MEKGVLRFERELFVDRRQLHDLNSIQRPTVGAATSSISSRVSDKLM